MQKLAKNPVSIVCVCLLALGGGLFWITRSQAAAVAVVDPPPEGYENVTEVERDAILEMLAGVGLDPEAMGSLNVTEVQAEAILCDARDWWETNSATLASRQATIDTRTQELLDLQAAIRTGPDDEGHDAQLATAITNLLNARSAYAGAMSSLRTQVATQLSQSQETAWASVEVGVNRPMPLRLLDLTVAQRSTLANAWEAYRSEYLQAGSAQARATAVSTYNTRLAEVLTQGQEDVTTSYTGYWVDSGAAVITAIETVLPIDV